MIEVPIISKALEKVEETDESYIKTINLITDKEILLSIIDELIEDKDLLKKVAFRSYSHFNGFYKIILYKSDKYKVRLHVWLPSKKKQNIENIHFHRWKFVSKILLGEYKCLNYKIDPAGKKMNKCIYYPRSGKENYQLVNDGFENLTIINEKTLLSSDFLVSKPLELHRVIPNRNKFTASLLLQGPNELEYSNVYNENEIIKKISSPSMKTEELESILKIFKEKYQNYCENNEQ